MAAISFQLDHDDYTLKLIHKGQGVLDPLIYGRLEMAAYCADLDSQLSSNWIPDRPGNEGIDCRTFDWLSKSWCDLSTPEGFLGWKYRPVIG